MFPPSCDVEWGEEHCTLLLQLWSPAGNMQSILRNNVHGQLEHGDAGGRARYTITKPRSMLLLSGRDSTGRILRNGSTAVEGAGRPGYLRSPLGPPTQSAPSLRPAQPQELPRVSYVIQHKGKKTWGGAWTVARADALSIPIYEVSSDWMPFKTSERTPASLEADNGSVSIALYRLSSGTKQLIGSVKFFAYKWDVEITINGRFVQLEAPTDRPSFGLGKMWWSSSEGRLTWQDVIESDIFRGSCRLVDQYRRVCAVNKPEGRKGGPSGSLELYGDFDETLVDEIVISHIAHVEQLRRRNQ